MIKKYIQKNKENKGFALLFTVMLSAIMLAVALGISGILLKEINFGTSAQNTNDAFFAADTGAECALYYDRSDINGFGNSNHNPTVCAGTTFDITSAGPSWLITLPYLGTAKNSCAIISVTKDPSSTPANTVISTGYSNVAPGFGCTPTSTSVSRVLEVTY